MQSGEGARLAGHCHRQAGGMIDKDSFGFVRDHTAAVHTLGLLSLLPPPTPLKLMAPLLFLFALNLSM